MQTADFTPGPWRSEIHGTMPNGTIMYWVNDYTSVGAQNVDDVRLIAAAPELYAELQQFVNGVETRMIDSPADETLANITSRAKAALAKARGEQLSA